MPQTDNNKFTTLMIDVNSKNRLVEIMKRENLKSQTETVRFLVKMYSLIEHLPLNTKI